MILYVIIDAICLQGTVKAASASCFDKLQNIVIAGPGQKGMRDPINMACLECSQLYLF